MACNKWRELIKEYRGAAKVYSEVVSCLTDQPGDRFNATWQKAEKAHRALDQARSALLYHEHMHDCLTSQYGGAPKILRLASRSEIARSA
jgi:hypothetical protein